MGKIILYVFITIFLLGIASAVSPFTSSQTVGCEIKYPAYSYLKVDSNFDFNFHVFNSTDGTPMSNATMKCVLHLYNSTGDHSYSNFLIVDNYTDHYTNNEWVVRLNKNNFSKSGSYSYIIQCNQTGVGCFASVPIEVNPQGMEYTTTIGIIHVGLLFILCGLFFLSLYFGFTIQGENQRGSMNEIISINWKKYLKYFSITMAYISFMWISYIGWNISYGILRYETAANIFEMLWKISAWGILPLIIIFIVFALVKFANDLMAQKEIGRNLIPDG